MRKSLVRCLQQLFAKENLFLTIAIIAVVIIIVPLNMFVGIISDAVERNAIVFLLGLLAASQLIERISILPRLENTLTSTSSLLNWAKTLGLECVYRARSNISEQEILETVLNGKQVDLLGVSHSEIIAAKPFTQYFLQDVHDGRRKLRLLLLNPTSVESARREKEEGEVNIGSLIDSYLMSVKGYLNVSPQKLGSIVRLYNHAPSCMIIRSDDIMYVIHYVHGASGNSPAQKLRATSNGLFEIYLNHFENIWKQAEPFQEPKIEQNSSSPVATT